MFCVGNEMSTKGIQQGFQNHCKAPKVCILFIGLPVLSPSNTPKLRLSLSFPKNTFETENFQTKCRLSRNLMAPIM